jgi:hypothetical protein
VTLACRGRNTGAFVPGSGPDVVFHWDNIGLDGPVIPALRGYEIPDNTTVSTFTGDAGDPSTPAINIGYLLLDGTTGKAAGICSPITLISSLAFENVNLSGMNTALLTFNVVQRQHRLQRHSPYPDYVLGYQLLAQRWPIHDGLPDGGADSRDDQQHRRAVPGVLLRSSVATLTDRAVNCPRRTLLSRVHSEDVP